MRDLEGSINDQRYHQGAEGCCKTATDLDRYRRIIGATRPDGILETGTCSGKSALWFAREGNCPVFTVDRRPQVDDATLAEMVDANVEAVVGRSTQSSTVMAAYRWADDKHRIMVTLDSHHSSHIVRDELDVYAPLVGVGCYCVVEDTLVRWLPEQQKPVGDYWGSPLDAVEEYLAKHPEEWENDLEIEDLYPTTQHPGGWLRRR